MAAEWQEELKNNTRLRMGLWAILSIVGLYFFLVLDDYQKTLISEFQTQETELGHLQAIFSDTAWKTRSKQTQKALLPLDEKLWPANSQGLAQADMQAWLNESIKLAKLKKTRIEVENPVPLENNADIWQISAKISAQFDLKGMYYLLYRIGIHKKWSRIEQLNIRRGKKSRFTMTVLAYFRAPL
jgi:hypothetical protein